MTGCSVVSVEEEIAGIKKIEVELEGKGKVGRNNLIFTESAPTFLASSKCQL